MNKEDKEDSIMRVCALLNKDDAAMISALYYNNRQLRSMLNDIFIRCEFRKEIKDENTERTT